MFISPHEFGLCTHHVSSSTDLGLVSCSRKDPHFLQKNHPAEISGYRPVKSVCSNPILATKSISGTNNFPLSPLTVLIF